MGCAASLGLVRRCHESYIYEVFEAKQDDESR